MAATDGAGGQAAAGGAARLRRSVRRANGEARRAGRAGPPEYVHLGAQVLCVRPSRFSACSTVIGYGHEFCMLLMRHCE